VPPSVPELIERLGRVFGEMPWRPSGDPVGELVLTILSQHTSDRLSGRAFANLLAQFPSWEAVLQAPTSEVAECIAGGGLSNQKAPRIKAVLERIHSERGSLDLHFLSGIPLNEARTWLVDLPGVGPETAAASVAESVMGALRKAEVPSTRIRLVVLAMAGAGRTSVAAEIRRRLAGIGLDAPLVFESDLLATYFSGTHRPDGYAVIAGTGAGAEGAVSTAIRTSGPRRCARRSARPPSR